MTENPNTPQMRSNVTLSLITTPPSDRR